MVYLDADKQTYADLNVTGNVYGEQALCSLFLKAETKKGKSLMLDWIMHPLSDWEEICKRQEAIAWDFLPELPLNEEELDFIEYYLEYREQIRGANILLSCATIIDRLVRYDPNRYVVSRGVKLVFLMLSEKSSFRSITNRNCFPHSNSLSVHSSLLKYNIFFKEKGISYHVIN